MKVVSNTGPIIALAKANLLPLLKPLFGQVLIPPAVHKELFAKAGEEGQAIEEAFQDYIHPQQRFSIEETLRSILSDIDEGERQAIGLASSVAGDVLLLMDDNAGRRAAGRLGIPVTGVVGILLLAKEKGLIHNLSEPLEEIRNNGYWLAQKVIEVAKQLAGE